MPRDGVPYISPIAERPTPPQRRKNQRFVHSIELSNPQLKYRLCLFPAPPTDLKLTTRPAGMCEAAKMSHNDVHRYGFVLCPLPSVHITEGKTISAPLWRREIGGCGPPLHCGRFGRLFFSLLPLGRRNGRTCRLIAAWRRRRALTQSIGICERLCSLLRIRRFHFHGLWLLWRGLRFNLRCRW